MPTIIGIEAARWLWGKSWSNKKLTTGTFKDPLPMTQVRQWAFLFVVGGTGIRACQMGDRSPRLVLTTGDFPYLISHF